MRHAEAFAAAVDAPPQWALDLGSGGGIPGLVLAQRWPSTTWRLLDANQRRSEFLRHVVPILGLSDRVEVVEGRAEAVGHGALRQTFDLVVARSFGPPAVTAECAAAFLGTGGRLLVSEPPADDPSRWPAVGLARLGLADQGRRGGIRRLVQQAPLDDRFPRRVGIPAKRPLW